MSHGDKRTCLLIKVKDRIHHQKLLFHGNAGIIFMECILLKKSKPDHAGDFQDELLIVGKNITSDQLDNFKQAAFLILKSHQTVAVVNEFRGNVVLVPGA